MTELINLGEDEYSKFDVIRIDRRTQFGNPFKLKEHGGDLYQKRISQKIQIMVLQVVDVVEKYQL